MTVTAPLFVDTQPALTLVAVVGASSAAVGLVGAVSTISLAVALPLQVDAHLGVGALEFVVLAVDVAISLVGAVLALEFAVAFLGAADAPRNDA